MEDAMAVLSKSIRRLVGRPLRRPRTAQADFRIVRDENAIWRESWLLARHAGDSAAKIDARLRSLWDLNTTALYVQIYSLEVPLEFVLTRHSGKRIVAAGQKFRIETETQHTVPDGAYLQDREYRRLGFYESAPLERALILLRIRAGSGFTYVVDLPSYVTNATVHVGGHMLEDARLVPPRFYRRYAVYGPKSTNRGT